MTARIAGRIVINRPVEEVFDVVADECNEPHYNPRMARAERISADPVGQGSRCHAETRSMGRTIEMDIQNTGYQRPDGSQPGTAIWTGLKDYLEAQPAARSADSGG